MMISFVSLVAGLREVYDRSEIAREIVVLNCVYKSINPAARHQDTDIPALDSGIDAKAHHLFAEWSSQNQGVTCESARNERCRI